MVQRTCSPLGKHSPPSGILNLVVWHVSQIRINQDLKHQFLEYAFANRGPARDHRPAAVPDKTPPTAPAAFTFTRISASSFLLRWTLATDNVAVAGYLLTVSKLLSLTLPVNLYHGAWLGNTEAILIEGVTAGLYRASLQAVDLAGNIGRTGNVASGRI